MLGEPRQMLVANLLGTGIGEPDSVDHSAVEFGDSWCPRPLSRLQTHGFGDKPANSIEVDDARQLTPVSGGASGKQNRILELDPRGGDCERGRRHRYRWPPTRDS